MADPPSGIFFDELSKVRVLEPEISQQTQELKGECKEFVDSKFYSVEMRAFSPEFNVTHVQQAVKLAVKVATK